MKKYLFVFIVTISIVGFAEAAPVQWSVSAGGNGHWYDCVEFPDHTWYEAKADAETTPYMGVYGYLVTITSQEEQNFLNQNLFSLLSDGQWGGWTSGYQLPGSDEPGEGWVWITGEVWTYTDPSFSPNNDGGVNENTIAIEFYKDGQVLSGGWNDRPDNTLCGAYIVEYVPEPATLLLLGLGGLMLRKRKA